jgi:hypothetical protein
LAASWLMMSVELPTVSAVIARLPDEATHLAAYGSVVFPLALIIEAPVIMLLAASTALSKDAASYRSLRRFTHGLSLIMTLLHAVVAFTPLFDLIVPPLLDPPPQVIEPARIGFIVMIPWTWPIAYRRFCQGVLIRFGRSREIGWGTLIRLISMVAALAVLAGLELPGVTVGAGAVVAGVIAEALYARWRVGPVVRARLSVPDPNADPPLRGRAFAGFYVPLALTSLITLLAQPIVAAGMGRMPAELISLATWPVITGLLFSLQALGLAYNEVVVAMIERPEARAALRRFTVILATSTAVVLAIFGATPLAELYLSKLSSLPDPMVEVGRSVLWIAIPIPAVRAIASWYQGALVVARQTRPITEAVAAFMVTATAVLVYGVSSQAHPGLVVGVAAYSLGRLVQVSWLWFRSRQVRAFDRIDARGGTP